jgi:hypothetical protein
MRSTKIIENLIPTCSLYFFSYFPYIIILLHSNHIVMLAVLYLIYISRTYLISCSFYFFTKFPPQVINLRPGHIPFHCHKLVYYSTKLRKHKFLELWEIKTLKIKTRMHSYWNILCYVCFTSFVFVEDILFCHKRKRKRVWK